MTLAEAFQSYIDLVQEVIASNEHSATTKTAKLSPQDILSLTNLVVDLESKTEFQDLIRETAAEFSDKPYMNSPSNHPLWGFNVEAYFRRSGLYLSAYKGEMGATEIIFKRYREAFEVKQSLTRYLVPLQFVEFDEDVKDFDSFRLVKLSRHDLESLMQNEINRVFFPYAYADISSSKLDGLWFLETAETHDALEPGSGGVPYYYGPEVSVTFADYPLPVIYGLKHLVLYDWGTDLPVNPPDDKNKLIKRLEVGWIRFHVPFIISLDENPLWPPRRLPNLSGLETEPIYDDDGEEMGESLVTAFFLEAEEFNPWFQGVVEHMAELKGRYSDVWSFLDLALNYLVKAFFAEGVEQLLWHMVVIEALLGDESPGLTNNLGRRVSFVVAEDEGERSRIKRLITNEKDGLYQLRSNLVHGNTNIINRRVYFGHLREARELARRASLWFLKSLSALNQQLSKQQMVDRPPTREEIIAAIDVLSRDELNTDSVRIVLDVLSPK